MSVNKDKQLLLIIRILSDYENITFKILDIMKSDCNSEIRNEIYDYLKEVLKIIIKEDVETVYKNSLWIENAYEYLDEEKSSSNSKWFSGDLYYDILLSSTLTAEKKLANIRKLKKFNDVMLLKKDLKD